MKYWLLTCVSISRKRFVTLNGGNAAAVRYWEENLPALGGRRLKMVATVIYDQYLSELNWPMGATLAVALLLVNLLVMLSWNRMIEGRYKKTLGE